MIPIADCVQYDPLKIGVCVCITNLKILSQTVVIDSYIGPTRSLLKSTRPAVGDLNVPIL